MLARESARDAREQKGGGEGDDGAARARRSLASGDAEGTAVAWAAVCSSRSSRSTSSTSADMRSSDAARGARGGGEPGVLGAEEEEMLSSSSAAGRERARRCGEGELWTLLGVDGVDGEGGGIGGDGGSLATGLRSHRRSSQPHIMCVCVCQISTPNAHPNMLQNSIYLFRLRHRGFTERVCIL